VTWRANGNYYSFKEEAIKSHAPSVSGVYGLYNFRHQILIGNSPDIHGALLRHLRETHFRFRRFEPTGFTFEVCPPESRELRTQELIREYDPILRANRPVGLAALWRSWTTPSALAFHPQVALAKIPVIDERKENATNIGKKKQFKRFHFSREQLAMVSAGFGVIILAMGLFMLSPHLKSVRSIVWQISSMEKHWALYPKGNTQVASLTPPPETAISPERARQKAEAFDSNTEPKTPPQAEMAIARPKPETSAASESTPYNDSISSDSKKTSLAANREASQKPQIEKKAEPKNLWAVQAMATTDERIASVWMEKLKAKGYDAFVVKAEIKGQTWYRVRAGNFSARQEAEALRTTLQAKEGFPDAFVAASAKSGILVALNP
jgi:cell division septation protein DedD